MVHLGVFQFHGGDEALPQASLSEPGVMMVCAPPPGLRVPPLPPEGMGFEYIGKMDCGSQLHGEAVFASRCSRW